LPEPRRALQAAGRRRRGCRRADLTVHCVRPGHGTAPALRPDFKYWTSEASARYLKAADYPEAARRTIKAMHEQVGPLQIDSDGLARRGVLIRHLVMPGALAETRASLEWVARQLGSDSYVNLMDQYHGA
jgi:putative pyruvate formate lyase activating enzyme